jgi:hypothetical protein
LAELASYRDAARITRIICALAFAAAAAFGASAARAADCAASPRDRIILSADTADPDVFVWDDEMRLIDYSLGRWSDTRSIMIHTVLAHPGTQAFVVGCVRGALHSRYAAAGDDAIRLKMTSGPYRGRFGWVSSRDAHPAR